MSSVNLDGYEQGWLGKLLSGILYCICYNLHAVLSVNTSGRPSPTWLIAWPHP